MRNHSSEVIIESLFFGDKTNHELNRIRNGSINEIVNYLKCNKVMITEKNNKPAFHDMNYKRRHPFKINELVLDEEYFEGYSKELCYDYLKRVVFNITVEYVLLRDI